MTYIYCIFLSKFLNIINAETVLLCIMIDRRRCFINALIITRTNTRMSCIAALFDFFIYRTAIHLYIWPVRTTK